MSFVTGIAPTTSPGVAPRSSTWVAQSTFAGVAPDTPHYVTASTKPNASVEDTFDSAPAKGALGDPSPPVTCVEFPYIDKYLVRGFEEEDWVIETSTKIPHRHILHGAALPGIIGARITEAASPGTGGAGITGA